MFLFKIDYIMYKVQTGLFGEMISIMSFVKGNTIV